MPGPWEKYAAPAPASGEKPARPWEKYGQTPTETQPAAATEPEGNYVQRYSRGVTDALAKAAEGDGALDGLKDLAQGAASFASQIASPVLASLARTNPVSGPGLTRDESFGDTAERFVYRPQDRGAQGIAEVPAAVLKPVGDVFQAGGKAVGSGARAVGAPEALARDLEESVPAIAGVAMLRAPAKASVPGKAPRTPTEVARAAGYKLLPSEAGGKIGSVAETLAGSPQLSKSVSKANAAQPTKLALKELGLPEGTALTPETFAKLKESHNAAYQAVSEQLGNITPDAGFQATLSKLGGAEGVTKNLRIAKLRDQYGKLKDVPAAQVVQEVRTLRESAQNNLKTPFGTANRVQRRQLGKAQQELADALDGLIERRARAAGKPELAKSYRESRTALAKINTVERATEGGQVSGQALAKAQRKGAPLSGGLKLAADVARKFPQSAGKPAKVTGLESAVDLATGGLRGAVLRPGVRALLESQLYQNSLGKVAPNLDTALPGYFARPGDPSVGPPAPAAPANPAIGPPPPPYLPDLVNFEPPGGAAPGQLAPDVALRAEQLAGDLGLVPELTGAPDGLVRTLPTQGRVGSGSEGTVRPSTVDAVVGDQRVAQFADESLVSDLLAGLDRAPELPRAPQPPAGLAILPDALASSLELERPRLPPDDLAGALELLPDNPTPVGGNSALSLVDEPSLAALLGDLEALAARQGPAPARTSPLQNNASGGNGGYSAEAASRVTQERAAGQTRYRYDDRTGQAVPITGVESVDAVARPGEVILQRGVGADPYTVLDRGGLPQSALAGVIARFLQAIEQQ